MSARLAGMRFAHVRPLAAAPVFAALLGVAGCDPIVNIQGSFFPAWIVCMSVGIVFTAALRLLFAAARVEPYLGPVLLIYPSLWTLLTLAMWLAFYRT